MPAVAEEVCSSLRERFQGDLLLPADAAYEASRGIWNGSRRNVVCLAGDSQHASPISEDYPTRATFNFAHASSGAPVFYDREHRVASGNISDNLFCRRLAMVDSGIFGFSGADLAGLPAQPAAYSRVNMEEPINARGRQ